MKVVMTTPGSQKRRKRKEHSLESGQAVAVTHLGSHVPKSLKRNTENQEVVVDQ